ncbi:NAD(P)/FAD-dependent oxidoreductase [Fodinibius sp.]|uniref:NAD(P)/FAD-dependent oxidoreductase n=1 Tax=Fodinibius sp. TaxID=1872440 RepID=UPI0035644498
MESPSFWEQDIFARSGPYDLVIVGAGIVGLSSALFYKRDHPEAEVAVLERGARPLGASTRNAGFACVGSVGEHRADLRKESEAVVRQRIKRRYRGLRLLKETLGREPIGYEHCGGYELFRSGEQFERAAADLDRFNRWMEELLGEASVYERRELEGYPVIYNRLEGALHPGKMMRQLIRAVTGSGVEIRWSSPVEEVSPEGTVRVAGAPAVAASQVLLAVNGFSRRLLPSINIKPARGLVLVTDEQDYLPWQGTFHHDRGYVYFRNIGDRLLIGGARNLAFDEEETDRFGVNDQIRNYLVNFVSDVLLLPDGWSVDHQWSGIMGFTESKTPVVQQLDEYRYVAGGLSGMGIAIGMEVGRSAAKMIGGSG